MWHASPTAVRGEILAHGLVPSDPDYGSGDGSRTGVYLAVSRDALDAWLYDVIELGDEANTAFDIWSVDAAGLTVQTDILHRQARFCAQAIGPDKLLLVETANSPSN